MHELCKLHSIFKQTLNFLEIFNVSIILLGLQIFFGFTFNTKNTSLYFNTKREPKHKCYEVVYT